MINDAVATGAGTGHNGVIQLFVTGGAHVYMIIYWFQWLLGSIRTFIYFVEKKIMLFAISSVQSLSRVQLFSTPWTAACQASLSITNSWSLLKLMSIKLVMPSNHFILCRPLLLLPSIFPSIRVFSNELVLHIKVAKVLEFQLQHQSFQ